MNERSDILHLKLLINSIFQSLGFWGFGVVWAWTFHAHCDQRFARAHVQHHVSARLSSLSFLIPCLLVPCIRRNPLLLAYQHILSYSAMETRLSAEGVKDVTACVATWVEMRARFMETQTRLIQQSTNTLTWVMCRWRAGQDYLDKKGLVKMPIKSNLLCIWNPSVERF